MYGLMADGVLVLHLSFVLFVAFGALLALRWPWIVWLHLPAAAWGVAIEFAGWVCPLTPLENQLRGLANEAQYSGDFVGRYVMPLIYPEGLTRDVQIGLGAVALLLNVGLYAYVMRRRRLRRGR